MKQMLILALSLLIAGASSCGVKTRQQLKSEDGGLPSTQPAEAPAQKPYKEKAPPAAYRFEEIDEQMRTLNGRVDALENRVNQADAVSASEKQSVTTMAKAIDDKFVVYEEELKKLGLQIQALNEKVAQIKAPVAASVQSGSAKSRSAYDEGEELFNKKSWKEAIVEYSKYREANPKGKMYADATYKIGVCFQELKLKDEAKAFFDEVIAKSPNSKEAKKAAFRMKSLK